MTIWYKILDEQYGQPHFLYHGINRSKLIPLDQWIVSERKWVKEGSNPYYWSGFHVYPDLESVTQWLHRIKKMTNRVLVEITTREIRKKPTRGKAYLAAQIYLSSEQWADRILLVQLRSQITSA